MVLPLHLAPFEGIVWGSWDSTGPRRLPLEPHSTVSLAILSSGADGSPAG